MGFIEQTLVDIANRLLGGHHPVNHVGHALANDYFRFAEHNMVLEHQQ